MKIKLFFAAIVAAVFFVQTSTNTFANTSGNEFLKVKKTVLDNGFTVLLNEDPNQPEVMGGVVVKVGGKHDPADNTGIAHYLEHMLFKGTTQMGTIDFESENAALKVIYELYEKLGETDDPESRKEIQAKINKYSLKAGEYAILNEMDNLLRSIGSSRINAFTGEEITFYFNTFPPNQFEGWAEIYSHRFKEPVFRAFQAELEVVYEEKNRYMDVFATALIEKFNKNFYKNHPYGQQTILGDVEHLRNPSLNAMYDFYNTYYVANNMALVLSGDFKTEEVMPIIEKKFGNLRAGDVPDFPHYEEESFNGRESVKARLSPIRVGIIGYRTVPNDHPDKIALDVAINMLSNSANTGFLDRLATENRVMAVMGFPQLAYNDYGAFMALFVPRIFVQPFRRAENLVLNEIQRLSNGDFSDEYLQAVKNSLVTDFLRQTENVYSRGVQIARAFTEGIDANEALQYNKYVSRISRDDIVRVAQKYFTDDYLVLQSRMGSPKKEKLDKPGYDPIEPAKGGESVFAKTFKEIPASEPNYRFVDVNNDFSTYKINDHTTLFFNRNPLNDVFSAHLRFFVGEKKYPQLKYASRMMNYAGTPDMDMNTFKERLQLKGCTYYITSNENYVNINIRGLEKYSEEIMSLFLDMLKQPVIDSDIVKTIYNQERGNRRLENADPASVGAALLEYARKGERSTYLDRPSLREIKRFDVSDLTQEFMKVYDYPLDIHFSATEYERDGSKNLFYPYSQLAKNIKESDSPYNPMYKRYEENTVLFVNKANAIQSQIYIIAHGSEYNPEEEYLIDAFNDYFGGGFSGLVMQEIREYRSMAYATGAQYRVPVRKGFPMDLVGFIGTQGDKTSEAIKIYLELLEDMPSKPERLNTLREALIQKASTSRPDFRNLSLSARLWELRGFNSDPAKIKVSQYQTMSFEDIEDFYKNSIQGNPFVICVVGDKDRIDMETLKTFGKFIEFEEDDIFSK